ncbi:MAG: hypothetical protein IPM52_09885 [Bacteroidetes bacterium]|nr:hypothetical protein [Bacteroidota bacterium]
MSSSKSELAALFARPFGNHEKKAIAAAVVQQPEQIGRLLDAISTAPPREAARMAWVVEEISANRPEALEDFTDAIIALVLTNGHQAVLRNMLKVLLLYRTNETFAMALFDRCLQLASAKENEVAVRCNALSLAHHIAMQHPGLEHEVFVLADNLRHEGSAGFRARTRMLMEEMKSKAIKKHGLLFFMRK